MSNPPLSLHPDNPHTFRFRDKLTVLITSGEHYGAVMNRDFDYAPYLETLAACEFNQTRLFSGTYRELPGSHSIENNTMAPEPTSYLCPWRCVARNADGAPVTWDLTQWDEAYWARLQDFVAQASDRGIVVEYVFFCYFYNETLWRASPMNPDNNVNGLSIEHRSQAYELGSPALLSIQAALVRKVAQELNGFDNIIYEIINEPYSSRDGTLHLDWQHHLVDVLVAAESALPNRHLIALNYENRVVRIAAPHPDVSILNFHYADPAAVAWNYHLNRAIADDETGFKGATPSPYRTEAWAFMLSGGAAISHLDYSFTVAHPDGIAPIVGATPGHGGPAWRAQLTELKRFLENLNLVAMAPHPEAAIVAGHQHIQTAVLADIGRVYAVYLWGGGLRLDIILVLPAGDYAATWINPADGRVLKSENITGHAGGGHSLKTPTFMQDLALKVVRVGGDADSGGLGNHDFGPHLA